jgi:hypothetical protein
VFDVTDSQWRKVWKKRWVALHGMEIVYMDKEPTSKNMSDITITKAQFTGASTVKEEDPDNDPTGFAIHVRYATCSKPFIPGCAGNLYLYASDPSSFVYLTLFAGCSRQINDGKNPPWYLRAEDERQRKLWVLRLSYALAIVKWVSKVVLSGLQTAFRQNAVCFCNDAHTDRFFSLFCSWTTSRRCACWAWAARASSMSCCTTRTAPASP